MKKEVFFGICWSGDGQECEKEAFFEMEESDKVDDGRKRSFGPGIFG